jgi:hypothetical protein
VGSFLEVSFRYDKPPTNWSFGQGAVLPPSYTAYEQKQNNVPLVRCTFLYSIILMDNRASWLQNLPKKVLNNADQAFNERMYFVVSTDRASDALLFFPNCNVFYVLYNAIKDKSVDNIKDNK